MDSFEGIIEFVSVAQTGGFSAAAKQLGCSTSHVSRQVSRLEARLDCALVARSTRLVSLTETGQAYYLHCKELVAGLEQANEQVSSEQYQLKGVLHVSAAGAFSEMYVVPALLEFAAQHPELKLEIDFSSRMVNFIEDKFDFAIRYGRLSDSGLVARKLVTRPMMAAASSDYIEHYGLPTHPRQLNQHRCLVANNEYWYFTDPAQAATQSESFSVKVNAHLRSNNVHALTQACAKGMGIAYLPQSSFLNLPAGHKLKAILQDYCYQQANT